MSYRVTGTLKVELTNGDVLVEVTKNAVIIHDTMRSCPVCGAVKYARSFLSRSA